MIYVQKQSRKSIHCYNRVPYHIAKHAITNNKIIKFCKYAISDVVIK